MLTTSGIALHLSLHYFVLGAMKYLIRSFMVLKPLSIRHYNNLFVAAEMIHSLFLINHSGDLFLEKHWKSVISRSVCDYFFEAKEKAVDPENVPPVLQTPHHYLITIYRDKLFFLSVIQTEVPPLFVIEFLHRVADTIQV